jgi:putative methyltransferase (TIGR04325 family)
MKPSASVVANRVLPPIASDLIRKIRKGDGALPEWAFLSYSWPERASQAVGWDHESICATQRGKWEEFYARVQVPAPLGVAHEAPVLSNTDSLAHNQIMTYAYVLACVARRRDRVSLLDWGGGSGHFYVLARTLFPDLQLDYHCRDLPSLAALGRELLPEGTFHDDNSCLDRKYDVVVASTSLQYSEDWMQTASQLLSAAAPYLYIANLPVLFSSDSFTVLQRPHKYGYLTEYVCWFLNREAFLRRMDSMGADLVREFLLEARPDVSGAPELGEYRGYLFRARAYVEAGEVSGR